MEMRILRRTLAAVVAITLSVGVFSACTKTKEEKDVKDEIRDISSIELVKEIKVGWSLGNTLDAPVSNPSATVTEAETGWGNPVTTKENIDAVVDAGFNIIRIPVTWEGHFGAGPDFKIDKAWMDRVQEVVDYAYDRGIFVILNIHHEEWHFPSREKFEGSKTQLIKIWEQIAERFKNYDEHLIFEGMNEPRLKGTSLEWTGGDQESRTVVDELNAVFVDTIRKSGGNNPLRHLMIPTYAASSTQVAINNFAMPDDNKVIVSIHAYLPYQFALAYGYSNNKFDLENLSDTREIDDLIKNLDSYFIQKGIPVIIGEFGARDKANVKAREVWADYYVKAAKSIGVPCIWWDNGSFSGNGEVFGLLDRTTNLWKFETIKDALINASK